MSSLHPDDRRLLQELLDWKRSLRGGGVLTTNNSVFLASPPQPQQSPAATWRPLQYIVKSEEDDYLTCAPYRADTEEEGVSEVLIAKPLHLQKTRNGEARTIWPAYKPNETVVWAERLLYNVALDEDGNQIALIDLNFEGRHTSMFWAKVTSSTLDTINQWTYSVTEQTRTATGWEDLTDGRVVDARNSAEANNDGSGEQGNSVDLDSDILSDNTNLELVPIRGEPVVLVREDIISTGDRRFTIIHYPNAIDGECGSS